MKTLYLNIGECEVIKDMDIHIKIVLGSCIGIVVFHEESKVVGAIHILLPLYKNKIYKEKITAFADTGIKHLIKTMKNFTGEIKDYKAIMAGGADLGRSNYYNIGRDNYIVCKKILEYYDIDIIFEDCLGSEARVVNFYTKDFKYNITPVSLVSYPNETKSEYNISDILKDIRKFSDYFPVLNKTIMEIIRLKNKDVTPEKLEQIMLKDDFVSVNFLKFANSSYISPKYKIKDIKHAISYVGIKNTFKFINSLFIQNMVKNKIYSYSIDVYEYKVHILSVALLSELISEHLGITDNTPYIGGLFHDIGKVILDFYALKKYKSTRRAEIISFVEDSISSYAHAYIGRLYLETLNLDEKILDIVEYHHYPHQAKRENKTIYIVALANLLISSFLIGTDNIKRSKQNPSIDEIVAKIQIDISILKRLINNIPHIISIAEEMII